MHEMTTVFVVGGAGYIGSHMVKMLLANGISVITLDNLSKGHKESVLGGEFIRGCLSDTNLLDRIFSHHDISAVMHFASSIEVSESVTDPSLYYRNNFSNTINLLDAMVRHEVKHFIFSSTAAIFGEPEYIPINEQHSTNPINPYGKTKLMVEHALADYEKAYGIKYICLRYFNAAGADPDGEIGERHQPESHLIPLVLQAASGRRESISIYGDDYPTPDGTCIRDYIHVTDLCAAHLLALKQLISGPGSNAYNLGNGIGFSIRNIIDEARELTGVDFTVKLDERRKGDPAVLVADATAAINDLGWKPSYVELNTIIRHAWAWEKKLCKLSQ